MVRGIDYKPCKLSKGRKIEVAHHQNLHTSSKGSPTQKTASSASQKTGYMMCDDTTMSVKGRVRKLWTNRALNHRRFESKLFSMS